MEQVDPDAETGREWFGRVAKAHGLLAGTLVVHAVFLIARPELWNIRVNAYGRSNMFGHTTAAKADLVAIAAFTGLYLLVGFVWSRTSGERSVARVLVKIGMVIALWVAFYEMISALP